MFVLRYLLGLQCSCFWIDLADLRERLAFGGLADLARGPRVGDGHTKLTESDGAGPSVVFAAAKFLRYLLADLGFVQALAEALAVFILDRPRLALAARIAAPAFLELMLPKAGKAVRMHRLALLGHGRSLTRLGRREQTRLEAHFGEALERNGDVSWVNLHSETSASEDLGGAHRRTGTAEWFPDTHSLVRVNLDCRTWQIAWECAFMDCGHIGFISELRVVPDTELARARTMRTIRAVFLPSPDMFPLGRPARRRCSPRTDSRSNWFDPHASSVKRPLGIAETWPVFECHRILAHVLRV